MSVGFLDLVRVTLSTLGTGSTLTISAAVAGWLDFTTAGGVNGTTYRYAIIDGNNTEIGTAVYNSGTNTLSGRTVTKSTNSNLAINLTSQAILAVSVAAEDLNVGGTNYGTMAGQSAAAVAITGGSIVGLSSLGVGSPSPDSLATFNANSAASATPPAGTVLHLVGAPATNARLFVDAYAVQANFNGRRANGTIASPSNILADQVMFNVSAFGYGATGYSSTSRALINFIAGQDWTDAAQGAYIAFSTNPNGSASAPSERMRIWSSGGVQIGGTFSADPGAGNLQVNGTVAINISTLLQEWLNVSYSAVGGTSGASAVTLGQIGISEGVTLTSPSANLDAMAFVHNVAGGAGERTSWQMMTNLSFAAGSGGWNATTNGGFVTTLVLNANAGPGTGTGVNVGGTALAPAGQLFCFNPILNFFNGSTFYLEGCNTEHDVNVPTGASVSYLSTLKLSLAPTHAVNASVLEGALVFSATSGATTGWQNLIYVGTFGASSQSPMKSNGTIFKADGSVHCANGINLAGATFSGNAYSSPGFSVAGDGSSMVLGTSSILQTNFIVNGQNAGGNAGARIVIDNGAATIGSIGNYSAVNGGAYNKDFTIGADPTNGGSLWLTVPGNHWTYMQANANGAALSANYNYGLAIGWNQSAGGGEVNLVANIDGGSAPWDFIFQDWNGTTLTNIAYISKGGGIYVPNTNMQTTVGGGWGTGASGTLPTAGVAGTADTFFAEGFFSTDSTTRTVPYNTSGVLLSNALQATLYVGNHTAGTGDPTPQGSTQAVLFSSIKTNASAGTAVTYGQTGGMIINVTGGWSSTTGTTFAKTGVTLVSAQKTYTMAAAPTSFAYVPGMPVVSSVGPGVLPASTVIVSVSGNTVTLNNAPTSPGSATLTFWAGVPVTTPATTPPTVPNGAYNPFAGTPGDTFAINGQVAIYDNAYGIAQFLQYVCSAYNLSGVLNIQQVLTAGLVTSGQLNTFASVGVHATGWQAQATSGSGIGFGVYIANAGGSWSFWGASSSGNGFAMTTLAVSAISDPSIKRDIRKLPSAKRFVMSLDPVAYRMQPAMEAHAGVERGKEFLGFLSRDYGDMGGIKSAVAGFAEDIIQPGMVSPMGTFDGYWRDEIVPALFRGVQEIWAETDVLLDRMNGLEARVSVIESRAVH